MTQPDSQAHFRPWSRQIAIKAVITVLITALVLWVLEWALVKQSKSSLEIKPEMKSSPASEGGN